MNLTEGFAELVGVVIGDGWIYTNNRKYQIGFVGNPKTDREYFEKLKELIHTEWKKEAKIVVKQRGIRIVLNSKEICMFLTGNLKMFHGEGKCEKIVIPEKIYGDWNLARKTIRGIADTDGSVFVAKKPRIGMYPSIEIDTCSRILAEQLKKILTERGFKVAKIWSYQSKKGKRISYKVPLNGKENLKRWVDEIGFSNPNKFNRAVSYLK